MYYLAFLTIPPQTSQGDPYVHRMEVAPGVISHVDIGFPQGCVGLVHLQIYRHEHQLYPTTPGESFGWDNYVFSFDDAESLDEEPHRLTVRAWNDDDSYPHTLMVGVSIEPFSAPLPGVGEDLAGYPAFVVEGEIPY